MVMQAAVWSFVKGWGIGDPLKKQWHFLKFFLSLKKYYINLHGHVSIPFKVIHGTADGLRSALLGIGRHDAVQLLNRALKLGVTSKVRSLLSLCFVQVFNLARACRYHHCKSKSLNF